ncbi:MAG TPA: hypothetical protein PKV72_07055, partial [Candidatus Peribacteria bacterium]|nr:hypothetical protein [Candidatus Peribacteria bacterium]
DPFAHIAEQRLGSGAITFTDPVYSELYVLESRSDDAAAADTAGRLLRGMLKAETFIEQHPDDAKRIVMGYTNLDRATIDAIWSDFDFHLALTPELRDTWTREADWARATGKAKPGTANPDFDAMVWEEPLMNVASDRITR